MNLRQAIRHYRKNLTSDRPMQSHDYKVVNFYHRLVNRKIDKIIRHFNGDTECFWDWQESTFYHAKGKFYLSKDALIMQPLGKLLRGEATYINYWEQS